MNVLYTSLLYRNKKIKNWQEGILKISARKTELYTLEDELLDSVYKCLSLEEEYVQMDKYLIQIPPKTVDTVQINTKTFQKFKSLKFTHRTVTPQQENISDRNHRDSTTDKKHRENSSKSITLKEVNNRAHKECTSNGPRKKIKIFQEWKESNSDLSSQEEDIAKVTEAIQKVAESSFVVQENIPVSEISDLEFPTKDKLQDQRFKKKKRTKSIVKRFNSEEEYVNVFRSGIIENLQILVNSSALLYYQKLLQIKGNKDLEKYLRKNGIAFYQNLEFFTQKRKEKCFTIRVVNKEHNSVYSKDDIWVIGKDEEFKTCFLATSVYYGPLANGNIEISPISKTDLRKAQYILKGQAGPESVFCIRLFNACGELSTLPNIIQNLNSSPLIGSILANEGKKNRITPLVKAENAKGFMELMMKVASEYSLNDDQSRVLLSSAKSCVDIANPVTLVHGAFGAGKSYLIAVLIIFYHRAVTSGFLEPENFRILVSSNTNVAVDRVLLSLLKLDFNSFVRVGSLRKISKTILPFTAQQIKSSNEDLKELNQMLKNPTLSAAEREDILLTLKKFSSNENKNIVSKAFVLGVTCLSSASETMSDFRANLVILDECSQMTEPTSMLPILRFGAERLLLVGDPLQLPPTISTPCEKGVSGLDFTFFERMAETHIMPILLRTQYRCHPSIGSLSNDLFYEGSLTHSSQTSQLTSVIPQLPHVVFVDSLGSETNAKLSFINAQEAESIVNLVLLLIEKGVSCKEMDKGQADYIRSLLDSKGQNGSSGLQISTVDAFQGAEKDLIVLSTIRTNHIGFIDDPRRINVALTRSKRNLIIFGCKELLCFNKLWSSIINRCEYLELSRLKEIVQNPINHRKSDYMEHPKRPDMAGNDATKLVHDLDNLLDVLSEDDAVNNSFDQSPEILNTPDEDLAIKGADDNQIIQNGKNRVDHTLNDDSDLQSEKSLPHKEEIENFNVNLNFKEADISCLEVFEFEEF